MTNNNYSSSYQNVNADVITDVIAEWRESTVDDSLTLANVTDKANPWDLLMYSDRLPRTNIGRLSLGFLRKYRPLDNGGWWVSGVDPLTGEDRLWGQFKPITPRRDRNGKPIKYEAPPKEPTEPIFLRVPQEIQKRISSTLNHTVQSDRDFWAEVIEKNLPIIVTEGTKKSGAILCAGYPAISLPGVWNGRKKEDITELPYLDPLLQPFATKGRTIYFAYDQDDRAKTVENVTKAMIETGKLFRKAGCEVKVIQWDKSKGKGVDDFIASSGRKAFRKRVAKAVDLGVIEQIHRYRQNKKQQYRLKKLSYPANKTIDQRYLEDVSIPSDEPLVCIKSAKGTGKTERVKKLVEPRINEGNKTLVVTHRNQLGIAICDRIGVPHVDNIKAFPEGDLFGLGLCVDSMHIASRARFNPDHYKGATVFIDEVEQVIWHLLNSSTKVKDKRQEIIDNLIKLLYNCVAYEGQIIIADADLSWIAIDFIKGLIKYGFDRYGEESDTIDSSHVHPWILENLYQGEGYLCNVYQGFTPYGLFTNCLEAINNGEKALILVDGQKHKSKWGTRTLERTITELFPEKKVLRIDQSSVGDESHPAYCISANVNAVIADYDVVIASPTICTGISIDTVDHFDGVWGIFQGVLDTNTVRQFLMRLRDLVPRHIWARPYSNSKVGNGAYSPRELSTMEHKKTRALLKALQIADSDSFDLCDEQIPQRTWARIGARINLGMGDYRQSIIDDLITEGHDVLELAPTDSEADKITQAVVDDARNSNYFDHCQAVATADSPNDIKHQELKQKNGKTQEEQDQEQKGDIERFYLTDEVTPELVANDDDGFGGQIKLHYYLSLGNIFVKDRDRAVVNKHLHEGRLYAPDVNKPTQTLKVHALKMLGFEQLLEKGKEWTKETPELVEIAKKCKQISKQVKAILGITITDSDTPIAIAQKLLGKIGAKLRYLERRGDGRNSKRVRVYGSPISKFASTPYYIDEDQGEDLDADGRFDIFQRWYDRDIARQSEEAVA